MKKTFVFIIMAICLMACTGNSKSEKKTNMEKVNETLVRLETTMGNITVKLYDETPKHKENFIKLVKEGAYDSTLFHRVIKNFMIQAGDPLSKNATDTTTLGSGDVGYTIPAESYYLRHTFENNEDYLTFLRTIESRSRYDFNVKLDENDKILTLSTCLDYNGNRIVLHAKLVKSVEK